MIYAGHALHCRFFDVRAEEFKEFKAPFATSGLDDDQRLDLAAYHLRSAYCDILAQLHLKGIRRWESPTWWCTTHRVIDTDSAAPIELVAVRG